MLFQFAGSSFYDPLSERGAPSKGRKNARVCSFGQLAEPFGVSFARGQRFVILGQCRMAVFSQDFFDVRRKLISDFFLSMCSLLSNRKPAGRGKRECM